MTAAPDRQSEEGAPPGEPLERSVVEALYHEHAEELRRLLWGVLRDAQAVADVLQITFTKVLTAGHTSREETRKAWLFRVAYHEALVLLRRRATGEKAVRRLAWSQPEEGDAVEAGLIREEMVEAVRGLIETLPIEQRKVLRMRIYEEKTFAQIAAELQIPLGTALGRMRNALEKLRSRLSSDR